MLHICSLTVLIFFSFFFKKANKKEHQASVQAASTKKEYVTTTINDNENKSASHGMHTKQYFLRTTGKQNINVCVEVKYLVRLVFSRGQIIAIESKLQF